MADATVVERESTPVKESEEEKKVKVMNAWRKHLQKEGLQEPERNAIFAMIKNGVMPWETYGGVKEGVRISDAELIERYKDLPEALNNAETRQKLHELETKINEFTKESKIKSSPAPGEVLRKNNKFFTAETKNSANPVIDSSIDWTIFKTKEGIYRTGWTNDKIKEVYGKLRGLNQLDLAPKQIQVVLEMLVGKHQNPDTVLQNLTQTKIAEALATANANADQEKDPRRKRDVNKIFYEKFFSQLGISQEWVQKYIYPEIFKSDLDREYESRPGSIEEMAWQISVSNPEKWGVNGTFPLLQMRMVKNNKGEWEGRYYVNEANLVRWQVDRMMYWEGESPDAPFDFQKVVFIKKDYRDLDLDTMFENEATMFKSEDGTTEYRHTVNQMKILAWAFTDLRRKRIDYESVMTSMPELMKKMGEMFYGNSLTKLAFGKNMFYYLVTMPLDFHEPTAEDGRVSDNKLGNMFNELYLAYYNISDFDALQNLLGKDSSFFTKQGMLDALETVIRSKKTGEDWRVAFFNSKLYEAFEKAFNEQGKVGDTVVEKNNFISLVNLFKSQFNNPNHERMVRQALMDALKQRYGNKTVVNGKVKYQLLTEEGVEDDDALKMVDVMAYSLIRPTGAGARNDTGATAFDKFSELVNSQEYRLKMANPGRGGSLGNPYTIPQFKRMAVDLMQGITTEAIKEYKDANGKIQKRQKTPLEVLQELQLLRVGQNQYIRRIEDEIKDMPEGSAARIGKQEQLDDLIKTLNKEYQNIAGQLEFQDRAMANYFGNHLNRAAKVYTDIMDAKEFNPEQYLTYDAMGGIHFNRDKFQQEVQDKIKDVRYLWSTYDQLNMNMMVRATDPMADIHRKKEEKGVRKEMKLGEALFGYEMVNRKKFWMKDKDGNYVYRTDGRHEIDWDIVQANKKDLFKQMVLTRYAAGFYASMAAESTDPRKKYHILQNMIGALGKIIAGVDGSEFGIKDLKITEQFFNKKDIAWLRHAANMENFTIYTKWILKSIFAPHDDKGNGLLDAIRLFFKGIVPTS